MYTEEINKLRIDNENLIVAMRLLEKIIEHPELKRIMSEDHIKETHEKIKRLVHVGILINCRDILNLTNI